MKVCSYPRNLALRLGLGIAPVALEAGCSGLRDHLADGLRQDVLGPDLDNARTARTRQCQQGPEIKVVREDDVPVVPWVAHLERQTVRITDKSGGGGGVPAVDGFEIDDGGVAAKVEDVFADTAVASATSLLS